MCKKIFFLLICLYFIPQSYSSDDKSWGISEISPYPSINISAHLGAEVSPEEIAGKADYQTREWKETEAEIAANPSMFLEQYEALREEIED